MSTWASASGARVELSSLVLPDALPVFRLSCPLQTSAQSGNGLGYEGHRCPSLWGPGWEIDLYGSSFWRVECGIGGLWRAETVHEKKDF